MSRFGGRKVGNWVFLFVSAEIKTQGRNEGTTGRRTKAGLLRRLWLRGTNSAVQNTQKKRSLHEGMLRFWKKAAGSQRGGVVWFKTLFEGRGSLATEWLVGEQKIYSCWSHKRNQVPNVDVGKYLQHKYMSQEQSSCSSLTHVHLLNISCNITWERGGSGWLRWGSGETLRFGLVGPERLKLTANPPSLF